MSTAMLASLEAAIEKWIDKEVETPGWERMMNGTWFGDTVVERMAQAAYQVLVATAEVQKDAEANK